MYCWQDSKKRRKAQPLIYFLYTQHLPCFVLHFTRYLAPCPKITLFESCENHRSDILSLLKISQIIVAGFLFFRKGQILNLWFSRPQLACWDISNLNLWMAIRRCNIYILLCMRLPSCRETLLWSWWLLSPGLSLVSGDKLNLSRRSLQPNYLDPMWRSK